MRSDIRLPPSFRQNHSTVAKTAVAPTQQHWLACTAGATLLVGVLLACIGANAQAQTAIASTAPAAKAAYTADEISHAFNLIDTNSDGSISRSEAAAFRKVANYFDAADTDHDGALSLQEFAFALKGGKSP